MPHRQKTLETAAATAASAYRRLLRAAASLPEGPVRSKAFANVRSLGREGGRGEGGASPPNGPGAADIRGGASLTASDALSASLLFRWVARLPKVRCEKSAERESAEGREREREREREKEEGESVASKRRRRAFFPFALYSPPPTHHHLRSLRRPTPNRTSSRPSWTVTSRRRRRTRGNGEKAMGKEKSVAEVVVVEVEKNKMKT